MSSSMLFLFYLYSCSKFLTGSASASPRWQHKRSLRAQQPWRPQVLLAVFMSIGALVLGNLLLDFSNSDQENLEVPWWQLVDPWPSMALRMMVTEIQPGQVAPPLAVLANNGVSPINLRDGFTTGFLP